MPSRLRLRGDDDTRRTDDRLAETVAVLVDLRDGPARCAALGLRHSRDGLVQRGVELLAERRKRLDAHARERGADLAAHEAHALEQRVSGRRCGDRAVEVVERRQELLGELADAALDRLRGLARDALSVVLEVRLRALRERQVLIALRGQLEQLVDVALDLDRVAAVARARSVGAAT